MTKSPAKCKKLALGPTAQRYRLRRARPVTFPPRTGRYARPSCSNVGSGFRRIAEGYQTIWLDLSHSLDDLRTGQHQNWRNALVQGERAGLTIIDDQHCTRLPWLIGEHTAHMGSRRLPWRVRRVARKRCTNTATRRPGCACWWPNRDGEPLSAVLLATHGSAATYLVGWTGEAGRDLRATHLLLWRSGGTLKADGKRRGLTWAGSATMRRRGAFQARLGGTETTLVGGTFRLPAGHRPAVQALHPIGVFNHRSSRADQCPRLCGCPESPAHSPTDSGATPARPAGR